MVRRCPGCGKFFEGDECPGDHVEPFTPLPPLSEVLDPPPPQPRPRTTAPLSRIGEIVRFQWPGEGIVTAMITSDPDAAGEVGLMVLGENVRRHIETVERIN